MLNFGYNLFIKLATVTAYRLFLTWRRSAFTSDAKLWLEKKIKMWSRLLREEIEGGELVEIAKGTRGMNTEQLRLFTNEIMRWLNVVRKLIKPKNKCMCHKGTQIVQSSGA